MHLHTHDGAIRVIGLRGPGQGFTVFGEKRVRPEFVRDVERYASDSRSGNVYFGLMTITESVSPLRSTSVAELFGSSSPSPSIRNL